MRKIAIVAATTMLATMASAQTATTASALVLSVDGQLFCEDGARLEEALKAAAAGSRAWVRAIPSCIALGANHPIAILEKSHWTKTLWLAKVRVINADSSSAVGFTVLVLQPQRAAKPLGPRQRPAQRQPAVDTAKQQLSI
jgi:hypothetical protein